MAERIHIEDGYTSCVALKIRLSGLGPLLHQWVELIKEYCKAHECDDNPWWYNERANLGLLAGAAWRLGEPWVALEEYPADKRRSSTGKNKKMNPVVPKEGIEKDRPVKGRVDLYVAHGSKGFAIEAKQAWQNLSPKSASRLGKAMNLARAAAGALHPQEAEYRVGAVFIIPFVPVEQVRNNPVNGKKGKIDASRAADRLRQWIAEAQLDKYSGYAYVYTENCEGYINDRWDRVFPGVILVLKNVRRARKGQANT